MYGRGRGAARRTRDGGGEGLADCPGRGRGAAGRARDGGGDGLADDRGRERVELADVALESVPEGRERRRLPKGEGASYGGQREGGFC